MTSLKEKILALKNQYPDITMREIGKQLNCSHSAVLFHLNPERKRKIQARIAQRRKDNRDYFINLFGGKCSICGYNRCSAALDFHHINPDEKEIDISIILGRRKENALKEFQKCKLVCSNCHREIHVGLISINKT